MAACSLAFTGNKGVEAEAEAGAGLGTISTIDDADNLGELGGSFRFKFRNFPYHDIAGWLQVGASWSTFPTGGDFGNQVVTAQLMGGIVRNYLEFGAGIAMLGDVSGVAPMFALPSLRLRVGPHDVAQFGFGMADQAPFWTGGGGLHAEGIFTLLKHKPFSPKLKGGMRLSFYAFGSRVPVELYGGVEARFGPHVGLVLDASLGDGGAGRPPSFAVCTRLGFQWGPGVRAKERPVPAG